MIYARIILPAIVLTAFSLCSCHKKEDTVACTMEFRTVAITVSGSDLDEYFTVRQLTHDTIRIQASGIPGDKTYPVLDDNYQSIIQDKTENFIFYGLINGVVTVTEPFVIKADKCHIQYVSGRISI